MKDAIFKNPKGSVQLMMIMVAVIFLFVTTIATPSYAQRKGAVIPLIETKTNTVYITVNDPAPVGKTGQTTSYVAHDDGEYEKGIPSPTPRFTTSANGTVTDHLTGLIWLQNGKCFTERTWAEAITSVHDLAIGQCGLTQGAPTTPWRLPNIRELQSLIDYSKYNPPLPSGCPIDLEQQEYWSSTSYSLSPSSQAHTVSFASAYLQQRYKDDSAYVIAVTGGQ
jgi:hypothetical protein